MKIAIYAKKTTHMKTVYTKEDLANCLKAGQPALVKGILATEIRKKKRSRSIRTAVGTAIASILLAPVTGGASIPAACVVATAGAISFTLSACELAIICGTAIAGIAIYKGCKVIFKPDGSVMVEPKK